MSFLRVDDLVEPLDDSSYRKIWPLVGQENGLATSVVLSYQPDSRNFLLDADFG
jgi:hypothetical protein